MLKESLICIIVSIIIYQLYLQYFKNDKKIYSEPKKEINSSKKIDHTRDVKPMVYETPDSFVHPQLGKPTKIIQEGYLFIINNPSPWSAIIYNQNSNNKYTFILKVSNISRFLTNYHENISNWKKILQNIEFNPKTSEIIIPIEDEDIALAISNLMLSNFKGDLSFNDITKKNLIQVSISKIKAHQSVRIKIIEQILENIEGKEDKYNPDYEEDLADTATASVSIESPQITEQSNKKELISAYEGGEYSFLN